MRSTPNRDYQPLKCFKHPLIRATAPIYCHCWDFACIFTLYHTNSMQMNVLLINPRFPDTYWSFKHALKFISKRSVNVPLGLITVAALLPGTWRKRLRDMNVVALKDSDIRWADLVMITAMAVQSDSVDQVIARCRQLKATIVVGGPLFTEEYDRFPKVDHLVLNEAEITLPLFIDDYIHGSPKRMYQTTSYADLMLTPKPDYTLLNLKKYAMAGIQYSRGCPFNCEFCDITALFGHKMRTKSPEQVIAELDLLYQVGWRGSVLFVDDNFIGNKRKLKEALLPQIIRWMKRHKHPFQFTTEASIDLSDDPVLMKMMVQAGFAKVFVGIETPDEGCLSECNKIQNNRRDLLESVHNIQISGMEVTGGFIVGFDSDPPNIFQRQIDFIQSSGIITAMVGLLNAPRFSNLYKRLSHEDRIISSFSGDNTDCSMNFIPAMNKTELMRGYHQIIRHIYSAKHYYQRVRLFLKEYQPSFRNPLGINLTTILALVRSFLYLGVFGRHQRYFWQLLLWSLWHKPRTFPLAITYSIYGYHFRKVFRKVMYPS